MKRTLFLLTLVILSSCKVQQEAKKITIKSNFITNEFLVQMNDLEQVSEVEEKFAKQELKAVDEVSDMLRIVLFEYDTTTLAPQKMMAKMKLSGYFREIEFNKKLNERSE